MQKAATPTSESRLFCVMLLSAKRVNDRIVLVFIGLPLEY